MGRQKVTRRRARLATRYAAILGLLVSLFVAMTASGPAASAEDPLRVRVGSGTGDGSAQALYAQRTGRFSAAGLAVDLDMKISDSGRYAGIDSGKLDIVFSNIVSVAAAIEKGKPYILLSPGAVYTTKAPMTVMVQGPASHFRSGADLKGKTVATPSANDLGQLGVMAWIDRHGGDSRGVTFVHGIAMANIGAALADRKIDAAELTEPEWTRLRKAGEVRLLAHNFDAISPRFANGAFFATRAWVETNHAAAARFVAAMSQTARWANQHHAETARMLAEEAHLPLALTKSMVRATYAEALTPDLVQPAFDVAAKYGLIAPVAAAGLIFHR